MRTAPGPLPCSAVRQRLDGPHRVAAGHHDDVAVAIDGLHERSTRQLGVDLTGIRIRRLGELGTRGRHLVAHLRCARRGRTGRRRGIGRRRRALLTVAAATARSERGARARRAPVPGTGSAWAETVARDRSPTLGARMGAANTSAPSVARTQERLPLLPWREVVLPWFVSRLYSVALIVGAASIGSGGIRGAASRSGMGSGTSRSGGSATGRSPSRGSRPAGPSSRASLP